MFGVLRVKQFLDPPRLLAACKSQSDRSHTDATCLSRSLFDRCAISGLSEVNQDNPTALLASLSASPGTSFSVDEVSHVNGRILYGVYIIPLINTSIQSIVSQLVDVTFDTRVEVAT